MSATTKDLTGLAVGDIIEGRRTMRVDFVATPDARTLHVGLVDVQSGQEFDVRQADVYDDAWSFNVVKKASKQYKVGDLVYRDEFSALALGTVIRHGLFGAEYMKTWNDRWVGSGDGIAYTKVAFGHEVPYAIRYLP